MADDSGIDPRYAAQFQRGFDPEQHPAPPARRGPVRLDGGPLPTAARVPDPPGMTATPEPATAADAAVAEPDDEALAPRARTWWDWLLPGLGAALIVLAFLLLWSYVADGSEFYGSPDDDLWDMFFQQAKYLLPGPLLIAGMVAVATGLVLQAVRPRE